jgi:PAS domain S-box-containing protein
LHLSAIRKRRINPARGTGRVTNMAAGNKKPEEKKPDIPLSERSLRDNAEEQLARSPKHSPDLEVQTTEALIHELQVHQIELETQAEELRKAHLALEESRDKYLYLFEFAPLGYLTLNHSALLTGANLTAATLLGIERSTLIRAPFSKFMSESDADSWHRYFMNILKQGEKQTCTLVLMRGDGSKFPARLEGVRLTGTDGAVTVRIAISDITDIHDVEEALHLANRKLTLLSSITRHDINNQLMALQSYLILIEKKHPDSSHIEYFRKAAIAGQRISAMIQFSKEYEQIGVKAPACQDCRTLAETAAKQAPLGKVMVKNDLPAGTEVFADPLIVKVWYNLMENAVRYGGKITTIRISADERDGDLIIACEDNGDGVVAGEKGQIFERGFGKNTGLGLFLSREILAITGITIQETGEPGKGARFEMTVPKGAWRNAGKGP